MITFFGTYNPGLLLLQSSQKRECSCATASPLDLPWTSLPMARLELLE